MKRKAYRLSKPFIESPQYVQAYATAGQLQLQSTKGQYKNLSQNTVKYKFNRSTCVIFMSAWTCPAVGYIAILQLQLYSYTVYSCPAVQASYSLMYGLPQDTAGY